MDALARDELEGADLPDHICAPCLLAAPLLGSLHLEPLRLVAHRARALAVEQGEALGGERWLLALRLHVDDEAALMCDAVLPLLLPLVRVGARLGLGGVGHVLVVHKLSVPGWRRGGRRCAMGP